MDVMVKKRGREMSSWMFPGDGRVVCPEVRGSVVPGSVPRRWTAASARWFRGRDSDCHPQHAASECPLGKRFQFVKTEKDQNSRAGGLVVSEQGKAAESDLLTSIY